tara:strand:- start:1122 stop:1700 length:579 start_codon:yes stop_codon:yes gene_type:complete
MGYNPLENMPRYFPNTIEYFVDNIVLIEGSDSSPKILAGDYPQIFEAIIYLIKMIESSKVEGQSKEIAQKLKKGRKSREFSRWAINDRILIKEALMNLYIQLSAYPSGTSDHPEDRKLLIDKINKGQFKPNEIPKENQASIVYQIYKYTNFENEWGNRYSDKKHYPEMRAIDTILRDMRRLFEVSPTFKKRY